MRVVFLEAAVPLTKTYKRLPDGSHRGTSYPQVTKVTSHTVEVETLAELAQAITEHAQAGHCLYSGLFERDLVNESRAGLTVDSDREWIMLDLDGIEGFDDVEDFIVKVLPKAFHNVSYVLQHSPSSGIKPGIRVHLFFKLYMPVAPSMVKTWLQHVNLATDSLGDNVTLSKNARALKYPLDIVVNDNARIIYITPPVCDGFNDPVTQRLELVEKDLDELVFNFAAVPDATIKQLYREKVEELRVAKGMTPTRKGVDVYETRNGKEYVKDRYVDNARITDPQPDNDRYMRCNLDGGDSYAYYYMRDQHDPYLHNFKGEPAVRIRLLDPEFYNKVVLPDFMALAEKDNNAFVFRDDITDKYYAGVRRGSEIIRQPQMIGSEKKIADYFVDFGKTSPPDPIPTWERIFDPRLPVQWMPEKRQFNTWAPTDVMKNAYPAITMPTVTEKVLRHVTGDEESYHRLVNWLAYIFQTREKSGQAWVLHGVPGTGKGLLTNYIIPNVFGKAHCPTVQIRDLRGQFNGFLEQAIFVNIDETNTGDAGHDESAVIEALKMWITEPEIQLNVKYGGQYSVRSFANFIFTTNDYGALPIQDGDRRFSVGTRQENKIQISPDEIVELQGEAQRFANFLAGYDVDEAKAREPLDNEAKRNLKEAARTSVDEFVHALIDGNLLYFIEGTHEDTQEYQAQADFKKAVSDWINDAKTRGWSAVTERDLRAAYIVLCSERPMKLNRFRSLMTKRGAPPGRPNRDGERWRGWVVDWDMNEETRQALKTHLKLVEKHDDIEGRMQEQLATSPGND